MELLVGAVVALVAWMLWNGLRPPGATVKSSIERDRRRRDRKPGNGTTLRLMLLSMPLAAAALLDSPAIAATFGG